MMYLSNTYNAIHKYFQITLFLTRNGGNKPDNWNESVSFNILQ